MYVCNKAYFSHLGEAPKSPCYTDVDVITLRNTIEIIRLALILSLSIRLRYMVKNEYISVKCEVGKSTKILVKQAQGVSLIELGFTS